MKVSRNVLMTVIVVLAVLLLFTLFYGCKCSYEKFEDSVDMKNNPEGTTANIMTKIDAMVQEKNKEQEAKQEAEMNATISKAMDQIDNKLSTTSTFVGSEKQGVVADKKDGSLSPQEQELFTQITENLLSGEELQKLIKAGILTENMIEKFLNKIDTIQEEKGDAVEGFCSGECYAKY